MILRHKSSTCSSILSSSTTSLVGSADLHQYQLFSKHQQIQHRQFSWAKADKAYAKAVRRKAIKNCHAPPSISAIPDDPSDPIGTAGAVIRPIGVCRRVFLINPYLTLDEIEGLAYRIRVLADNKSLSSVLIATDDDDPLEHDCLPSSVVDTDIVRNLDVMDTDWAYDPKPNQTWHVAGGYDPVKWYQSGQHQDGAACMRLMDSISALAMATHGGTRTTIPIITIPHGAIQDAGYGLCLSTYMLATEQTSLKIGNPSRGLTFDPVGYSFILPRLGQEFQQISRQYPGCGLLMALAGFTADGADMVETGLATHFMYNPTPIMGTLERNLGELRPHDQQGIIRQPIEFEADRQRREEKGIYEPDDHNKYFRNATVANTVDTVIAYQANGMDGYSYDDEDNFDQAIPAQFDFEPTHWHQDRISNLVNYAATFDEIFRQESNVAGILERFQEIAARTTSDPEEQQGIDVASDIAKQIQRQSPLAVSVTYRLMQMGSRPGETLESCMKREKTAQVKLMTMPDYANWAQTQTNGADKPVEFTGWAHKSLKDVPNDQVAEIIGLSGE